MAADLNYKPVKVERSKVVNLEKGIVVPHDEKLEQSVLSAMMNDFRCVDDVLLIIKDSSVFYKDSHSRIFAAIQRLHAQTAPVDLNTISSQLRSTSDLELAGGDFGLMNLMRATASSAHVEYHARLLVQYWVKRQIIKDSSENIAAAYADETDVFDLISAATAKIDNVLQQTNTGSADMSMPEALKQIKKTVERLSSKKEDEISGLPTGFKKVDMVTGGWQPTDLVIIAARPGMGKTALVLRTLLKNVSQGIPAGIISCEMSTVQLVTRMVAGDSHFHLNQLFRTGFEHRKYFDQLIELEGRMAKYPVYFDDHSKELMDVVAKVRLWVRKYGVRIVLIDYLQLMTFSGIGGKRTPGNREQEISTITRTLKSLAKELNIPIILLSQLSRRLEERKDKKPMLSDLRESGAIEQDADIVAFIYRPAYYNIEPEDEMVAIGANTEFIIAKHRNGSIDRIGLYFDENKTKFMDPEEFARSRAFDDEKHIEATGLPAPQPSDAFDAPNVDNPPF